MAVTRNPFNARLSWKWLVAIGILVIAISLVIGIILGVIAVHFSNATMQPASSAATGEQGEANALESQLAVNEKPQRIITASDKPVHSSSVSAVAPESATTTSLPMEGQPLNNSDFSTTQIPMEMLLDNQEPEFSQNTSTESSLGVIPSETSSVPDTENQVASASENARFSTTISSLETRTTVANSAHQNDNSTNNESRIKPSTESGSMSGSGSWTAYVNDSNPNMMNKRPDWLNVSSGAQLTETAASTSSTSAPISVANPTSASSETTNGDSRNVTASAPSKPSAEPPTEESTDAKVNESTGTKNASAISESANAVTPTSASSETTEEVSENVTASASNKPSAESPTEESTDANGNKHTETTSISDTPALNSGVAHMNTSSEVAVQSESEDLMSTTTKSTEELTNAKEKPPANVSVLEETDLKQPPTDSSLETVTSSALNASSSSSTITNAAVTTEVQINQPDEKYRGQAIQPVTGVINDEAESVSTPHSIPLTNSDNESSTLPSAEAPVTITTTQMQEKEETSNEPPITNAPANSFVASSNSTEASNDVETDPDTDEDLHISNDPRLDYDDETVDIDLGDSEFPCPDAPEIRIFSRQFCDERVDCPGATDERNCSCLERMNNRYPNRICDGVLDCPSMEDELGCQGCNETQFTCELRRKRAICLPLRQRCDGVEHCPDGMDEAGCSQLAPIELHAELSDVSIPKYSSGHVFRNIHNKWYPLCAPPQDIDISILAHSICHMAVGETTEKPVISRVDIKSTSYNRGVFAVADPTRRRPYRVTLKCPTSELLSITCPLPLCGRRAPTIQDAMKSALHSVKLGKSFDVGSNSDTEVSASRPPLIRPGRRRRRNAIHRIVGGVFSAQGRWPSMVAILKDGNFTCGGTLVIDGSWILSAAHCFESLQMHHFEAQLGMLRTTSFSPLEQTRIIRNVHIHPGYNRITLEDDIALLEVDTPFDLNQWAAPSCLSQTPFLSVNKTQCIVVGWGDTFEGGPESDELREVTLPLTDCTVETTVKRSKVLCAGYPDGLKDACQGDSGGPLMCPDPDVPGRWTLAGVVSSGIGCARPGLAGVYTRLSYYLEWINSTIKSDEEPFRKPRHSCPGMTCRKGAGQCLPKRLLCDAKVHCFDAEDEAFCQSNATTEAPVTTPMLTTAANAHETIVIPITFRPPIPSKCSEKEFMCFRELQCIDVSRRCNFVKDCADGTDELNCTCADYLIGLGKKELICDDNVDCKDSSDELGCRVCAEGEYFSFVSSECIPVRKMCDGSPDTTLGHDESGCVALSSSSNRLELDYKARPIYSTNGTVFINTGGHWQPLCAPESSILMNDICESMGFSRTTSLVLTSEADEEFRHFFVEAPSIGFLWKSPSASPWVTAKVATGACQTVNVACEKLQCGTRPAFSSSGNLEGNAPWHATLFANGKYLCGATLVREKWIVAAASCFENLSWTRDRVEALLGSRRFLSFASPNEQIRRISGYAAVPTNEQLLLLRLDQAISVNHYVNPVCMPDSSLRSMRELLKNNQCSTVGLNGTLLASPLSVNVKLDGLRSVSVLWHNNETFDCSSEKLVGGLTCSDGKQWYFVALAEKSCHTQGSFSSVHTGVWRQSSIISDIIACDESDGLQNSRKRRQSSCIVPVQNVEAPSCSTMRCPLSGCLSSEKICDGLPDCRDTSDEANCCSADQYRCSTGECINKSLLCDGVPDCPDGMDETNPHDNITCPTNVFRCVLKGQSRSNITVPFDKVCNGFSECPNDADEKMCTALSRELPLETDSNRNPKAYPNEGYMMVRISGTWTPFCHPEWDAEATSAACEYFGFNVTGSFKKKHLSTDASCNFMIYVTCS